MTDLKQLQVEILSGVFMKLSKLRDSKELTMEELIQLTENMATKLALVAAASRVKLEENKS